MTVTSHSRVGSRFAMRFATIVPAVPAPTMTKFFIATSASLNSKACADTRTHSAVVRHALSRPHWLRLRNSCAKIAQILRLTEVERPESTTECVAQGVLLSGAHEVVA
jgi:hypothetical protein